jgi:hypothetical protein
MIQLDEDKAAEARRELETLRSLLWNDSRVAFSGWCERLDHVIKLLRVPPCPAAAQSPTAGLTPATSPLNADERRA